MTHPNTFRPIFSPSVDLTRQNITQQLSSRFSKFGKALILIFCIGFIFPVSLLGQQSRPADKRDLHGISAHRYKYIFSVAGGTAVGAGLGFVLPGEKTPLKLAMIGGGGASTWFLHTHKAELGKYHDWGMITSNTALGGGIGWLGCNCDDGLIGGTLIGGGATAVWEALKNDSAAHDTFNRVK
jgi:hypothetical protein